MKPVAYFRFVQFSDEQKKANKLKVGAKTPRFDCVEFSGDYIGLTPFMNKKGQMFLYLSDSVGLIKANPNRQPEKTLINGSYNFSSLYDEIKSNPLIYYGYPNSKPLLFGGKVNPLYQYRNDLYLIIRNHDFTEFEVVVFEKGKPFASHYLQLLDEGFFDDDIEELKESLEQFYPYQDVI